MASLPAVDAQPIGLDAKDVARYIAEVGSQLPQDEKRWKTLWEQHFLLMTPAHTRPIHDFAMGRYEVTNAQWAVYLADPSNAHTAKTQDGADTLETFASACWGGGRTLKGADLQRAWLYLLALNGEALAPHLNPTGAIEWDPLVAQAGSKELPHRVELTYTRLQPPSYWENQLVPPEDERNRPVREISWEMAVDFCAWAGLHLPTEFEWERAARGPGGRRFAWGDRWDPLNLAWLGFNAALAETYDPPADAEPIGADRYPDRPGEVDTFARGATPEGIHHLHGNVAEWVANKPTIYTGSESRYDYSGIAFGARGGGYRDTVEVFLAGDRTWDGPGGSPLRPRDALESYGFRTAMYRQPGADLALPIALRYDDSPFATTGPPMWRPIPLGLDAKTRQKRSKFQHMRGFAPLRTAGVIERRWAAEPVDHAYISGPAKGIAFLPVKGFPRKSVRKKGDLARLAKDEDEAVLLGVLLGTPGLSIRARDASRRKDVEIDLHDPRFYALNGELAAQEEYVGAFLVLRPEGIAVMSPDPGNDGNPTKYLRHGEPLGYLIEPHAGGWTKSPSGLGVGDLANGMVTLTFTIPPLDEDPRKAVEPSRLRHAVRLTLRLPVLGW